MTKEEQEALQANFDAVTAQFTASESTVATLTAKVAELQAGATAQVETTNTIVAMAFEHNVSKEVALDMLSKPTVADAGLFVLQANKTEPSSTPSGDLDTAKSEDDKEAEAMMAYAKNHKVKA